MLAASEVEDETHLEEDFFDMLSLLKETAEDLMSDQRNKQIKVDVVVDKHCYSEALKKIWGNQSVFIRLFTQILLHYLQEGPKVEIKITLGANDYSQV